MVVKAPALLFGEERSKWGRGKAIAAKGDEAKFFTYLKLGRVDLVREVGAAVGLMAGALLGVLYSGLLSVAGATAEAGAEEESTSEALVDKLSRAHDHIQYIRSKYPHMGGEG